MLVIGNGESRADININHINDLKIGCNAIARDFWVDHLICVDRRMVDEANNNYPQNYSKIYTRADWLIGRSHIENLFELPSLPYEGNTRADEPFHWGSGPYAVLLGATLSKRVRLLGFDLYSKTKTVNNIYKDTANYDPSTKTAIDPRYWIHQIAKVFECFPNNKFTIYCDYNWDCPKVWNYPNVSLDFISILV